MTTLCILAAFLLGLFAGGRLARGYFTDGLADKARRCAVCNAACAHFARCRN